MDGMIGYNIADEKFYYVTWKKGGTLGWHNITHICNDIRGIKFTYTYINEERMRKDWLLPPSASAKE